MKHTLRLLVAVMTVAALASGLSAQTAPRLFQQALAKEQAEGKLQEAIQLYQRIVNDAAADRALKARALLQIGRCHEKLGTNEARKAYDRIVRDFGDQPEATAQARSRLASMSSPTAPAALPHAGGPVSRPVDLPRGVPSPDGQYFAYADDSSDLVVRELATGENRKVVRKIATEEMEGGIVWTRDSKRLVYGWWKTSPGDNDQYDLRIVNLDGSGMRILAPASSNYVVPLDSSPDGTLVAVASFPSTPSRQTSIELVPLASGRLRVLKTFDAGSPGMPGPAPDKAAFSTDGSYLAYSLAPRPPGSKSDIFRLPLDGSGETTIVQHPADDHLLGWTPDGRAMLFSSDRSGTVDIWLARIEDGRAHGLPERIKKDVGGRLTPMGFTATGTFFYRVGNRPNGTGGTDVFVAAIDPASGRVASLPAPIAQSHVGTNGHPRWSPDGRNLAYKARTDPAKPPDIIAIMSLDTGVEKYVRPQNFTMRGAISWHPDGRSFLVDGAGPASAPASEAPTDVFSIDIATANVTRLVTRPADQPASQAEWIDNGRSILFVSARRALVVRNIETGNEVTLYDAGDGVALTSPAMSPDGQQIAFRVWEGPRRDGKERKRAFMAIPRAGGQARELAPHHDNQGRWGQIAWAPDGRHLYFSDVTGKNNDLELWRMPSPGGTPQKVGIAMAGNMLILGIHPDGRRIAFMGPYGQLGTWTLENFLPKK